MRFVLVVNPHSGKKQSLQILKSVKPLFDSAQMDLRIIETASAGHAKEVAERLDFAEYDGFLALGGDGTFHEVVNGMFGRRDGQKIPLGIIPGGSGNSFLHDLGLVDPITATKAIISGGTRFVDTAKIVTKNTVLYSINLIGWVLVTDVGKRAEQLRWLGPSRYTVSSIIEIFLKKNRNATLVIDDTTFVDNYTFIVACNSVHVGKGMKMAPKAKLDDGLIDLIVVESDITRRRLLSVLPKLFDGSHIEEPEVKYYQASAFSLITDTEDILNIDGEMIGNTPIDVKMLKNAVELFA